MINYNYLNLNIHKSNKKPIPSQTYSTRTLINIQQQSKTLQPSNSPATQLHKNHNLN